MLHKPDDGAAKSRRQKPADLAEHRRRRLRADHLLQQPAQLADVARHAVERVRRRFLAFFHAREPVADIIDGVPHFGCLRHGAYLSHHALRRALLPFTSSMVCGVSFADHDTPRHCVQASIGATVAVDQAPVRARRDGRRLIDQAGRPVVEDLRLNAARNIAIRAIRGWPERSELPVNLVATPTGAVAYLRKGAAG